MFCLIIFFSFKVREGLYNGIQRASKNSGIKAVVIIGKGRTFPSGADITEFGKPPKGIRISSLIMPWQSNQKRGRIRKMASIWKKLICLKCYKNIQHLKKCFNHLIFYCRSCNEQVTYINSRNYLFKLCVLEPWLGAVGKELEESQKPVIAALHGTCLGGGLEIALFCHYRVAVASAR